MSNYTKSTNFATKDNLTPGDPLKIVRGTEIDTEFNNIATAVATKTDNSAAAITGGTITGITDLAIADGGTGASTANDALNNLLPSQTGNANKYLQTDGTNTSWDAVSLSTADITGTLPVANGGTGVTTSTGTGSVVLSNSPTLVTPALGTPSSGTVTNLTGTASININGTVGATTPSTGNFTTLTENSSPAAVQTDIGTGANEIPLNQYLGEMAYMDSDQVVINPVASATPVGIGDMVFQLTNDTTLVVKVKGSDGTVRSATLTLA